MIQLRTVAFSFVVRQYTFPTVVFSDEEFINRWKAHYEIVKNVFKLYFEKWFPLCENIATNHNSCNK